MFAASKTASSGSVPDPQFNYVSMLLHGDGTNGAQNNTFVDSSSNNFTITRNGNTTQGSFSPYGSNWSNYFDGSSYLSLATATALGTGNVTVEFWFYPTDISATYYALYDGRSAAGTNTGLGIFQYGQTIEIYGNGLKVSSAASAFSANAWTHFAVVRTSGTCQIYINGVASGSSASYSDNFTSTIRRLGQNAAGLNTYTGYISNVREVTSALYSGTFTPSTTPLTAISGTSLLTCQSNRFIDNSTNNFTITVNGNTSVQRFNPFGASTAYSTSVIGGSGYFDGSGDTLTTSTSQIIPSGSFTVECWAYVTGSGSNQKFVAQGSSGAAGRFSLGIEGGNWWVQLGSDAIQTGTPVRNQWNYVAATFNGSTLTLYVNGTSIGTVSSSANAQNTTLTIGQDWNSYITTGYIGDVRISNTVRTITSPTAPYSSDGSTRLLLSMTNGAIFDNAMMNDLETVGNAQISTSVVKYGTGSLAFDGSNGYLSTLGSPLYIFGTGDFTIECWLNITTLNGGVLIDFRPTSTNGDYPLVYQSGSGFDFYASGGAQISSGTITTGTWFHFALCRSGSSMKMFFNGTQTGSTYTASVNYSVGTKLGIGTSTYALNSSILNGYIDDLRITKRYARYTANFTPPTAAFPNTGPI